MRLSYLSLMLKFKALSLKIICNLLESLSSKLIKKKSYDFFFEADATF